MRKTRPVLVLPIGVALCVLLAAATASILLRSQQAASVALQNSVASIVANTTARLDREILKTETLLARVPLILGSVDGNARQTVVDRELRLFADQSALARDILVIAPDGRVLVSALPPQTRLPPETLAQMLGTLYRGPGETTEFALPQRNRTTGEWVALIARKIEIPGAGEVVAAAEIEIRVLADMIADRAPIERRMAIELRTGHLIAASPHDELAMGIARPPLPNALLEPNSRAVVGNFRGDGAQNAVAVRALHNRALALVATLDVQAGLAEWRADRTLIVGIAAAFAVLILGFAAILHRAEADRRRTAERLALLATVVENTSETIVITGLDGRIVWVNAAFERQTGYTAAEVLGQKPGTLLQGPETDPASAEILRSAIATQRSCDVEILNYTKAQVAYWQKVHLEPVRDRSGELTHYVAVQHDVSAQKRFVEILAAAKADAERNLAAASVALDQLRNAMAAMRDGLMLLDADDRVLKWNARVEVKLGLPPGFVREGMGLLELTCQALAVREPELSQEALLAKAQARIARHRQPQMREEELTVLGRSLVLRRALLSDGGIMYVYRDVTNERAATEQLEAANADVAAANAELQRKNLEMRNSEMRLALALETADLGWWERTSNGQDYWSPRTREIWGVADDVVPSVAAWRQCLHPDDRNVVDDSFDLGDGRHVRDYRVLHADGSVRYVRSQRLISRDETSGAVLALGTVLDYTDLETLRRAAEFDRQTLASAVNAMRDGIIIYDAAERVVSWNARALEIRPWLKGVLAPGVAYARIAAAGLSHAGLESAEIARVIAERTKAHKQGTMAKYELEVDGRILELTRIPIASGGSLGIARDVTEQKAYETKIEAARRSAEFDRQTLASAVNAMRDGIIIYDAADRVVSWNSRLLEICPWLGELLVPGLPYAAIPRAALGRAAGYRTPADVENAIAERKQAFETGTGKTLELRIDDRTIQVSRIPIATGESLGIVRDVTEQKAYEAKIEAARRIAEAASDAKTRFLANMSHELRTPLAGIVSMLALLDEAALDDEGRRQVAYARGSATHLIGVVGNVLDLSKLEVSDIALNSQPFDLEILAQDTVHPLAQQARKKELRLEVSVDETARGMRVGDTVRIRQILTNLVGNAIKFTNVGSVTVSVSASSDFVAFAVADTGPGIAQDQQARMFEDFVQVDSSSARRHEGVGLGLAISRRLAVAMGGEITLESKVGVGTTFRFAAPLPRYAGAVPSQSAATPVSTRLDGSRILLADDNEVNRYGITRILEKMGASVDVAADGAQAMVAASSQRYDAILMDMQMPTIDGLEATHAIRSGGGPNAGALIVALTANAFIEDRNACLAAGMDGFLTKPVSAIDIAEALAGFAAKRAQHTPSPIAAAPTDRALWIDRSRVAVLEADGGAGFAARLIGRFAATLDPELRTLRLAFEAGDVARIAALGHSLKSSARMVGAVGLGDGAETLERIAFDATPAALAEALQALDLRARHFREFAATTLNPSLEG